MSSKKILRIIHRWLGLTSGLVVFIVAITGAIYTFEKEISDWAYPYRKIEPRNESQISISEIKEAVAPYLQHINAIYFYGTDRIIAVRERGKTEDGESYNKYVYLNPYNAEVVHLNMDNEFSFFDVVVQLHINLLLGEAGSYIVKYATLIFFIILISGIYLWWPKNKKGRRQRFTFDWKKTTRWKRKNFDLHTVLGFYAAWIVLFAVITGLAWCFQWMDKAIYATATLGKSYKTWEETLSVSDTLIQPASSIEDQVLQHAILDHGRPYANKRFYFPFENNGVYRVYLAPEANIFYKDVSYHFDRRTGELLKKESPETKNNGEYVRDMYYDIHVGAILGLPGRLLMFFASLITASLPVTGFIMWWGKRKKKNKSIEVVENKIDPDKNFLEPTDSGKNDYTKEVTEMSDL